MLRTITSHASRRHRHRGASTRIQSSASVSKSSTRCNQHAARQLSTVALPSSSSPLACCLPCIDGRDCNSSSSKQQLQQQQNRSLSISSIHGSFSCTTKPTPSLLSNAASHSHHHAHHAHLPQPPTTIQKRSKVFVSRHNNTLNLSPQSITTYITQHLPHLNPNSLHPTMGDFRITNTHVVMKECPFCTKPTNNKSDNFYKLYVQVGGGAYFCHRCGAKGSWYDFKSELGGFAVDGTSVGSAANQANHVPRDGNAPPLGGGGGGGVSQPWNWNTSNNQGMSYLSTKQLNNNAGYNNSNGNQQPKNQKVEPLPMPPTKLNSIYTSKLFNTSNSPKQNPKEHEALVYLTETRGLDTAVLRKYGVGCASYNFASKDMKANGGMAYVSNMCVTFPWLLRSAEVAEQEELRGAEFVWKTPQHATTTENDIEGDESEEKKLQQTKKKKSEREMKMSALTQKPKKKLSEMTALEKYHYRKERKDRIKAAKLAMEEPQSQDSEPPLAMDPLLLPNINHPNDDASQVLFDDDQLISEEDVESYFGPYIPRRIKVRSISSKSNQRLDPPGGGFGLFGWHTVPHNATELIITEGEFDAMAVYQATGKAAVSLPNGCRSLPMEVLVLLEKFDTIYLWMDSDGPGREGAEMFARKLGVERCLVVQPSGKRGWKGTADSCSTVGEDKEEERDNTWMSRPPHPPKDANEALLEGWDLNELLEEASELPHERILKFSDLRDQVIHEIVNPEKYRGAAIPSLPGFTSLIKGFRRGEMTVLTGPTGSGKTTFLGQTSLDLAEQGLNVLWGSFEIKNTRLMHKLLQQYMKDVLPVGLADKDLSMEDKRQQMMALTALADKFETLPMHFMKFHGGSDVDDVLDAMEYAAYVHDVEHIILDNMQFMISRQASKGSSYDKFEMQDIAIEKFRKFATEYNVHVTLVVHPRKEDEGAKLGISSFYGSAKATQEADTVLILQSDGKRKFVEVKKNRFDGTLGHAPLYFDRKSGRYSENPDTANAPQRTSIPSGISALNTGASNKQQQVGGAKASASSVYQDIRLQHPVS